MSMSSSIRVVAPLFLLAAASAACTQKGTDDDGSGGSSSSQTSTTEAGPTTGGTGGATGTGGAGGSGGAGSTTSSGTGGDDPGEPGWTAIPLLDDDTGPNGMVFRAGNDLVTGIHFASVDDGVVTTTGSAQTFQNGGAIYKATRKEVTDLLFSGNRDGLCLLGTINFHGIDTSPDGYYALAHACDTIASHDGGASFDIAPNGVGGPFGIERVFAIQHRADETLAVHDTYVTTTPTAPGPDAVWNDVWAPEAVPTIPADIPDDQCEKSPRGLTPAMRTRIHVSADGALVAYVATQADEAAICVSQDGGRSFYPKSIPGLGEDASTFIPDGVIFSSPTVGVAWWANYVYPGQQWIARTTDGGQTWAQVDFPADLADAELELRAGFYAPDGQTGFLVGNDRGNDAALILKTTDAGATWARSGGDLASKVEAAGGNKLHTGFALDANHIWVGGESGIFMANEAGGE